MKKTIEEQIEDFLKTPIKVGQYVYCLGLGTHKDKEYYARISQLNPTKVYYEGQEYLANYKNKEHRITRRCTMHIGSDPFSTYRSKVHFIAYGLHSILFSILGFEKNRRAYRFEKLGEVDVPEMNWNPYIINKDGEKEYYQRPFVWELNDKQLLMDSIYNGIDCGKVIVRSRSFEWVQSELQKGNTEVAFHDIVDGKQRMKTLLEFVQNEFPDSSGNYWNDLSERAQHKFMDYQGFAYGELGEDATPEDILHSFLMINHAGKPQSLEHLEYVKSLLNKV